MTSRQFYDWQTGGGADDVMRMVDALERAEVLWCAIGGVAVNHWAEEPMVTRDVDFVVASDQLERAVAVLVAAGFQAERHAWSINFVGNLQRAPIEIRCRPYFSPDFDSRIRPCHLAGLRGGVFRHLTGSRTAVAVFRTTCLCSAEPVRIC